MLLAWITKWIIEIIRRLCYKFLWYWKQEKKRFCPCVVEEFSTTKGKWWLGFEETKFFFSKSLGTQKGWRLIEGIGLWVNIITTKYIGPDL